MTTLIYIINALFTTYSLMILARILGSWIPSLARSRFMHFLSFYTDPYLNLFRRFIPPIGGRLDISPILALISLRILQRFILYLLIR